MEHKEYLIEGFKADDDARTVEGYGSIFDNEDSYGDIVMPGAFARTIKYRKPAMLWQHRADMPIGVWDMVEERGKGLFLKGSMLDTTQGVDAYKAAKAGAVTGLSIGFTTKRYEIDEKKGVRKLLELELYEVSFVTFPANEKANITRVKSMPATLREFEEFLREEGKFSREDATTIALRGYKALDSGREAGDEDLELVNLLKQFKR